MKKNLSSLSMVVAFGGLIGYGVVTNLACSDDNNDNINVTTGRGGNGGGIGGFGGIGNNIVTYTVSLSAADEVPPNASNATGNVVVTLRPSNGNVAVVGTFRGLSSVATSAHIHGPAGSGDNAPIVVSLSPSSGTAGTISGDGTLSSDMVAAMQSGQTYVNIHTTTYPDGEIRGQINP